MHFRAFRQQTLATALTPTSERGASTFRAHARTKTVLTFPGALRALESAFHNEAHRRTGERAGKLGTRRSLSINRLRHMPIATFCGLWNNE